MLDSTLPGGALQSQKGKQREPIRSMGSSRKQLRDAKNTTSHSYCVVLWGSTAFGRSQMDTFSSGTQTVCLHCSASYSECFSFFLFCFTENVLFINN